MDSVLKVARHAPEHQKKLIINLSSTYTNEKFPDRVLDVLPYIDTLFGNQTEARALAKVLIGKYHEVNK